MFRSLAIALLGGMATLAPNSRPGSDSPTPVAALSGTPRPISDFLPSRDGFRFPNAFSGSPLPIRLGGLERTLGVPSRYGLCGGMSFAAADFFLSRRESPRTETAPTDGTALFKYISRRQSDSLGPGMTLAVRFSQWMTRRDDGLGGTREMTLAELGPIEAALQRGEPALLGLVFSRRGQGAGGGAVWENHQVLAYGAARASPTLLSLKVYDPNYPGADGAAIQCRTTVIGDDLAAPLGGWRVPVVGAVCERIVPGRRSTPVRGVFRMPYVAEVPPENLD